MVRAIMHPRRPADPTANDLKLSHYVKIPPRHMFYVQMWAG